MRALITAAVICVLTAASCPAQLQAPVKVPAGALGAAAASAGAAPTTMGRMPLMSLEATVVLPSLANSLPYLPSPALSTRLITASQKASPSFKARAPYNANPEIPAAPGILPVGKRGATLINDLSEQAIQGIKIEDPFANASFSSVYFDGASANKGPSAVKAFEAEKPELPRQFVIANPEHAQTLADIIREARGSRSGRKVLREIDDLVRRRKRPIIVEFTLMQSAHAYVDWDSDILRLSRSMLKSEPLRSAPVFIHELVHVLQRSQRLPYYAFELELEAWLYTLKVAHDLGIKFKLADFQGLAQKKFKGDYDDFVDWLRKEHEEGGTGMFSVLTHSYEEFLDFLKKRHAALEHKAITRDNQDFLTRQV